MRTLAFLLLALPLFAQNIENATVTRIDASRGVGAAIGNGDGWYAWTIPTSGVTVCCWQNDSCCGRCSLDGRHGWSINRDDEGGPRVGRAEALLVARISDGRVQRMRVFGTSCAIDGQGAAIRVLANVTPEQSIDYIVSHVRDADREGQLMAALSLHDHPRVVPELITLARRDPDREVRRHAIFWLGQKAGDKATAELRRAIDEDPDDDVRQHAVFAISQLPAERSVPLLIDLARTHKSPAVRKKALFWLAQTGDDRAIDLLEEILLR